MKELKEDNDKNVRYCVRCGVLQKTIRREGSSGCRPMGGYYKYHSYITDRELEEWRKANDGINN